MINGLYVISVSYPDLAESSRDHDHPLFYSFHVTMIATLATNKNSFSGKHSFQDSSKILIFVLMRTSGGGTSNFRDFTKA
jgi:hypothetical protein